MGDKTKIQWTDATWNPVTGCTKVSQGCKFCYAERVFKRPYPDREFTDVRCHPERLDQPLHWKKPRRIFVNSMSDLFHEAVPFEFVDRVLAVMADAGQHTFQILTKRPARALKYLSPDSSRYSARKVFDLTRGTAGKFDCDIYWPLPNVQLGVSCEDQETADERIPLLLQTPAAVRFVSLEPLLGPIDLTAKCPPFYAPHLRHDRIAWVIAGGESGSGARICDVEWIRSIVAQCQTANVPCFVKQLGGTVKADAIDFPGHNHRWAKYSGQYSTGDSGPILRHSKGGDWNEWPEDLRIREFPVIDSWPKNS